MTTYTKDVVLAQVALFVTALQKLFDDSYADSPLSAPRAEVLIGTKNIKVVRAEYDKSGVRYTASAHCFIDIETGNILKAASWKVPAKGVRGNIFTDDNYSIGKGVGEYGAAYFR